MSLNYLQLLVTSLRCKPQRGFYLCSIIFFAIFSFSPAFAEDPQTLQKNIKESNKIIAKQQQALAQVQRELHANDKQIDVLEQKLSSTNSKLQQARRKQQALNKQLNHTQTQLRVLRKQQAQIFKRTYMLGNSPTVKIILNNEDPTASERNLTYLKYLIKDQERINQEIDSTQQNIQRQKKLLKENQAQLTSIQKTYDTNLKKLNEVKAQKRHDEKQLNRSIASEQQKLKQMEQELAKLQKEIAERQARIKEQRKKERAERIRVARLEAKRKGQNQDKAEQKVTEELNAKAYKGITGSLPWPTKGKVIRRFGDTRSGEVTWKGILIDAPINQKVHAIASGDVLYAGWLNGFGNIVVIDHGNGYISLYGNNNALRVYSGASVKSNDVIATVGNSGAWDRTSLYFEIRYHGVAKNPLQWLKPR